MTDSARPVLLTGASGYIGGRLLRRLECDALSTALLVRGPEWLGTLRARFPGYDGTIG